MASDVPRRIGRPTLDEAVALKDRILDQTLVSVREKGSRGFSVDHVAAAAGVTKRTIYRHFASKAELIDAVIGRELDRLRTHVIAVEEGDGDPMICLKSWTRKLFYRSLEPDTVAFSNFISFEVDQESETGTRWQHWYDLIVEHVAAMIEDAQRAGAIRAMNSRQAALLLIDLVNGGSHRRRYGLSGNALFAEASPEDHFDARWAMFQSLVQTR